jgi:ligand-binding sensor domain-containing protein
MYKAEVKSLILICLTLAVIGLLHDRAEAVIRHWESFTSFNQVTDMALYKGDVWVATSGGLVRIDSESMTYETFNNVDGLEMNQIFSLCVDSKNRLWVGGKGRLVEFSDPNHPDGYLFTDRDGGLVEIYDIECAPAGDSLWLANRLGVTIFLAPDEKGTGLILDTYSRLGGIERDTPAHKVALDSDSVWVGTDEGLAVGSRYDIRQLKAPTGWVSYFPSGMVALPDDAVKGLVVHRDSVYVGTSAGIFLFDRSTVPSMTNLGLFGNPLIYNMSIIGDSILVNSARGSVFYHDGILQGIPTAGMPIPNTAAGMVDGNGGYWDGNLVFGIYYRQDSQMILFDVGGTPFNGCEEIIAAQGKIWGAFSNNVLAYYENGRWIPVPEVSGIFRALEVGPLGELWIGTHGNGAFRVLGDSVAHFLQGNSGLSGIYSDPGAVVVPGIYSTGNAIWFANYRGQDGELAAVNPYNTDQWQNYVFVGGDEADLVVTVAAGQDVVYVGSEERGIYALAYGGSPFYTPDDYQWTFTSANSGIGSDFIKELAVDGYDTLWAGTAFGLSYQALGEIYFTNIVLPLGFGPEVISIAFDGQGSLNAGSGRGIAVRDIGTGSVEYLTTLNTGLVDDKILDIYYESSKDAFWISTSGGISRMTMPYRLGTQDLDNIDAYPNPYIIRFGNETVRFDYSGLAEIRIFTLAGELVREIPVNGEWDGRNSAGETVASGVYLFTMTDSDKKVGRGKIFLIRE